MHSLGVDPIPEVSPWMETTLEDKEIQNNPEMVEQGIFVEKRSVKQFPIPPQDDRFEPALDSEWARWSQAIQSEEPAPIWRPSTTQQRIGEESIIPIKKH